jgi:hypothetical protein
MDIGKSEKGKANHEEAKWGEILGGLWFLKPKGNKTT